MRTRTTRKIARPALVAVVATCAMTTPYTGAQPLAAGDRAFNSEASIVEASTAAATAPVSVRTGALVSPAKPKPNDQRADDGQREKERQDAERKRRDQEIDKCMNDTAEHDGSFQDHVACQFPGSRAV